MTTNGPARDVPLGPRIGLGVVGVLLIALNSRASITAVGPVLSEIQADLNLSATASSALISLPLVAFAALSPVSPWVAARLGIERALGGALLVLMAGILLRSSAWVPGLWLGTFALGAAIAVVNVLLPALVKRDFPHAVGSATGAYMAVVGLGAAAGSGLAVPLACTEPDGWRLSLGIWAGVALLALAVFLPQLRRSTVPAGPSQLPGLSRRAERLRSPWTSRIGWLVTLYMGLQSTGYFVALAWWPAIERSYGVPAETAGLHQVWFQAIGIAANAVTAWALQRMRNHTWIAVITGVLLVTGFVGLLAAPQWSLLWLLSAGAGGGGSIVLALSLFGLRTEHHQQAAQLSGMAQTVGYLMAAVGPLLVGVLRDATASWTVPLLVLAGVMTLQTVTGVLASRPGSIGTRD